MTNKLRITKKRDRDFNIALSMNEYAYAKYQKYLADIQRRKQIYSVIGISKKGYHYKLQVHDVHVSNEGTIVEVLLP